MSRADRVWKFRFMASADFIGSLQIEIEVEAFESSERDAAERSVEECITRARKRVALGLLIAADFAMDVLAQEDRDDIVKGLQKAKQAPNAALAGTPQPFDE